MEGESINIDHQGGPDRCTALHLAATGSYYRIVNYLIDNGADLFIYNIHGKTPYTNITNNFLMIKILK